MMRDKSPEMCYAAVERLKDALDDLGVVLARHFGVYRLVEWIAVQPVLCRMLGHWPSPSAMIFDCVVCFRCGATPTPTDDLRAWDSDCRAGVRRMMAANPTQANDALSDLHDAMKRSPHGVDADVFCRTVADVTLTNPELFSDDGPTAAPSGRAELGPDLADNDGNWRL